jgi:hypothetical protein
MTYFGRRVYFDKFDIEKHLNVLVVYGKDTQKHFEWDYEEDVSLPMVEKQRDKIFPFGKLGQNCKT